MVAVPILNDFTQMDIKNIIEHSECKAIFTDTNNFFKVKDLLEQKQNQISLFRADDFNYIDQDNVQDFTNLSKPGKTMVGVGECSKLQINLLNEYAPNEETLASLIYTSGTTGRSKGVMLSHKNLVGNSDESTDNYVDIQAGDRVLSILPLSHVYEFTESQILTLLCGSRIYFLNGKPAVSVLLKAFADIQPHIINTVPLFIEKIYRKAIKPRLDKLGYLCKSGLIRRFIYRKAGRKLLRIFGNNIKFFGIGGAALSQDIEKFLFESKFPYALGYGLTETSPLIAASGPKSGYKLGFIGKIVPNEEVKIIDANPVTGIGEIAVKGPNVMLGYYKDEEMTQCSFTYDGFFKTGDTGYIDKENWLSVKGRIKTMILDSSGENIYPENIEFLIDSQKFVDESLVMQDKSGLFALIKLNLDEFKKSLANKITDIKDESYKYISKLLDKINSQLRPASRIHNFKVWNEKFYRIPIHKIK